jgi:hypothetical protein
MAKSTPQMASFDEGIASLAAGERAEARRLLVAALKVQPGRAEGWLWLRAAVETDRERAFCRQKALNAASHDADPDGAVAALRSGDVAGARRTLILRMKSGEPRAREWLWLSACLDDADQIDRCVQEALALVAPSRRPATPEASESDPEPASEATSTVEAAPARSGKLVLVLLGVFGACGILILCAGMILSAGYWTQLALEEIGGGLSFRDAAYQANVQQIMAGYQLARIELEGSIGHLYGVTDLRDPHIMQLDCSAILQEMAKLNGDVTDLNPPDEYATTQAHLEDVAMYYGRFIELFEEARLTFNARKLDQAWDALELGDASLEQARREMTP